MVNPTGSMDLSQPYIKGQIVLPEISEGLMTVSEGTTMIPSEGAYDRTEKPLHADARSTTPPTPSEGVTYYCIVQANVSIVDELTGPLAGLITCKYDATDYPEPDAQNQLVMKFTYDDSMSDGR